MARIYAGILGPLAFLTNVLRGAASGAAADHVLWSAWTSLWLFAALGCVAGWIAERTVDESVRQRVSGLLADEQGDKKSPAGG